ncbi:hypothetical protein MA16_Dca025326 [Dendrobium catenatum]|uniref:Uncharacterized protein n=1 Tax=Dendrobium catenatum TaxID=906689 RepID=A0A2I0VGQ3_9ASPA|nr:hypothetical protein MA16_Dca025326 [Dendrobium catenatum]
MAGLLDALGSGLVKLGWGKMNFVTEKSVGEEMPVVKEKETAAAVAANQRMVRQRSGVSISEATICMLMDRFAPS